MKRYAIIVKSASKEEVEDFVKALIRIFEDDAMFTGYPNTTDIVGVSEIID